jgi:hypothetical protein
MNAGRFGIAVAIGCYFYLFETLIFKDIDKYISLALATQ